MNMSVCSFARVVQHSQVDGYALAAHHGLLVPGLDLGGGAGHGDSREQSRVLWLQTARVWSHCGSACEPRLRLWVSDDEVRPLLMVLQNDEVRALPVVMQAARTLTTDATMTPRPAASTRYLWARSAAASEINNR